MGNHVYFDPGPRRSNVQGDVVLVELADSADTLQVGYRGVDGLETLNETILLFMEARSKLAAQLLADAESCEAHHLGQGDTIAVDGQVGTVVQVTLTETVARVLYHLLDSPLGVQNVLTVERHTFVRRIHNVPSVPCLASV